MPVVCIPALSEDIRARVEKARQKQRERFNGLNNGVMTNADMRVAKVVHIENMLKLPTRISDAPPLDSRFLNLIIM